MPVISLTQNCSAAACWRLGEAVADTLEHKSVKIRKPHKCFGCGRKMPKGTNMDKITQVDNGEFFHGYYCLVCTHYWHEHMSSDDEIGEGELKSEDPEGWEAMRQEWEPDDD